MNHYQYDSLRAYAMEPLDSYLGTPLAYGVAGRFVRFGFKGCPDVLGQLKDGRLLGVEVKAQAGRLRPEQAVFLKRIRGAGGVAFVARDLRDVLRELGTL